MTGEVSLNLKNVTMSEALETLREVYGYEYRLKGTRIYVQPNTIQTRLLKSIIWQIVGKERVKHVLLAVPRQLVPIRVMVPTDHLHRVHRQIIIKIVAKSGN